MATDQNGEVYATLLLSDTYLPGALVLAHSLLDNGTSKKLAVLVTEDAVSREAVLQLKTVYHHVISVPRIRNAHPQNLELMNRVDLHSAFTKIHLWRQTQFSKIVYIDADIVAYRAPDELFDIDAPFSAAPDIGWPDIFNTGVMVLKPDLGEYERLVAKAEDGESFDGADQGLLNMHFGTNYNRISFTYNVTPSAHYQYIPAYKHFQSSINMVHFIGAQKPWFQGRPDGAPTSTSNNNDDHEASPHEKMTNSWWHVYDRHYKKDETDDYAPDSQGDTKLVQYLVKGEFKPSATATKSDDGRHEHDPQAVSLAHHEPSHTSFQHAGGPHPPSPTRADPGPPPVPPTQDSPQHHDQPTDLGGRPEPHHVERVDRSSPPPMEPVWDALIQPPTAFSKPEAPHFPDPRYEMSRDSTPFVPPGRYPSPPRGMWYDIPTPRPEPSQKPKPIFPWESHQAPATRVFAPDYVTPILKKPEELPQPAIKKETNPPGADDEPAEPSSPALSTRSVRFRDEDEEIEIPPAESPSVDPEEGQTSPSESIVSPPSPDPLEEPALAPEFWNSSTAANAWDDIPGIRRYIERVIDQTGLGGRRRREVLRSRTMPGGNLMHMDEGPPPTRQLRRNFFKITDFPSAIDHPSLPVTPALPATPRDRWRDVPYWEADDEEIGTSPPPPRMGPFVEAEGVPRQSEWVCVHGQLWGPRDCLCDLANVLRYHKNPLEQLARLSADPEALLKRLEADVEGVPEREVPGSSEGLPGKSGSAGTESGGVVAKKVVGRRGGERDIKNATPEGGEQEGMQGKGETPLVAPVPLKRGSVDPVGSLDEAASTLEDPGISHKSTHAEVAGAHADVNDIRGRGVIESSRKDTQGAKQAEVEGAEQTEAKVAEREELKGVGEGDALRASAVSRRVLDF